MTSTINAKPSAAPVSGLSVDAAASQSTGPKTLGYESFLQLLIAQMRNQDPLEPTKSSDYVAQLATFSNVEKSVQMNTKLSQLLTNSQLSLAGSLVGMTASSLDGAVSGTVKEVNINSDAVSLVLSDGTTLDVATGVRIGGRPQ